jgi:hypothetical protein
MASVAWRIAARFLPGMPASIAAPRIGKNRIVVR